MPESDLSGVEFKLQDPDFDADFGYIVTWFHVGDLPNDNVNTNTFQVSLACDNDYNGSGRQRCVAIIYYHEIGYTVDAAGVQLIAGINGPGNTINYTLIPANIPPENISLYLTNNTGLFLLDLRENPSGDLEAVAVFDPTKFGGVDKMRAKMISCLSVIIVLAFVKIIVDK